MDRLSEWLPEAPEQPSNASAKAGPDVPVVVDFGSAYTRVGVASAAQPAHSFISRAARIRDRKSTEQRAVVGNDVLIEPTARNAARSPFDGPLLTNWDAAEAVLDYGLGLVGYSLESAAPIAISEALLAPHLPHRTMQELLFEGYGAPRVAFGADVLGAAAHHFSVPPPTKSTTKGDALLVYLGAEAMHVLPIFGGKPSIADARRIKWGGKLAADFLHELLVLKYPNFPVPVSASEVEAMLRKHCFVAEDYRAAVQQCMEIGHLSALERRVQAALPEQAPLDQERLDRQAERRKESGRRLQEQAAAARIERQQRQQAELEQLQQFEAELSEVAPEEAEAQVRHAGFTNMADVRRTIRQLNNTLRRARGETIEDPEPDTPLLNVPDEQLSEEQIKAKRRQRLLRASYDARQRARAEKEAKRQAEAAAEAAEAEWRARDLRGWAAAKRQQLGEVLAVIREREKLKRDPRLRFRQTLLEAEAPNPKRRAAAPPPPPPTAKPAPKPKEESKETQNEVDGDMSEALDGELEMEMEGEVNPAIKPEQGGTNLVNEVDDDEEEGEEEERDYDAEADALKALLLEHDPEFSLEDLEPRRQWHNSVVHKFLWGAHPLDPEDAAQQYQLNLNIERMRAVEPIFQPSMVGLDQAGLSEVIAELLHRFPQLACNIRLSGGFANLKGLPGRLLSDLRRELPSSAEINVHVSEQPELDAWRGIAQWSTDKNAYVSRQEYEENGSDYIREHLWGNPFH